MLLARLRYYLFPKTLEQSVGLWLLIIAIVTIFRPYAAALSTLSEVYHLDGFEFSVRVLGVWCAVSGALLIVGRRVGRLTFVALFLPAIFYSLCLTWTFALSPAVGVWGSAYGIGFWVAVLYMHGKRVSRREQAVASWI